MFVSGSGEVPVYANEGIFLENDIEKRKLVYREVES